MVLSSDCKWHRIKTQIIPFLEIYEKRKATCKKTWNAIMEFKLPKFSFSFWISQISFWIWYSNSFTCRLTFQTRNLFLKLIFPCTLCIKCRKHGMADWLSINGLDVFWEKNFSDKLEKVLRLNNKTTDVYRLQLEVNLWLRLYLGWW